MLILVTNKDYDIAVREGQFVSLSPTEKTLYIHDPCGHMVKKLRTKSILGILDEKGVAYIGTPVESLFDLGALPN